MKLSRESAVLYSLSVVSNDPTDSRQYTKHDLSQAMGISEGTFDLYLSNLSRKNLITRTKRRYEKDIKTITTLTDMGKEEVGRIEWTVDHLLLTEDRHNIPSCIEMGPILKRIRDPLGKVFFVSLYNSSKYFDLPAFLEAINITTNETSPMNIIGALDGDRKGTGRQSFAQAFYNVSLYGKLDPEILQRDSWDPTEIDALIVLAEAKIRCAKFDEAKRMIDYLLSDKVPLTQNQWFMVKIDEARSFSKQGLPELALKMADEILEHDDNKVHRAFVKIHKANFLFQSGDRQEFQSFFESAIRSFTAFSLPVFLSISYNSRGVMNFMSEDHIKAEADWKKAIRYAREAKSEYAEAMVLPNLADIALMNGRVDLAKKYLDRAEMIFKNYSDFEGLGIVEFNRALMQLELGDLQKALEYYRSWYSIAFPLPSPQGREIIRRDFLKRAEQKGFHDVETLLGEGSKVNVCPDH